MLPFFCVVAEFYSATLGATTSHGVKLRANSIHYLREPILKQCYRNEDCEMTIGISQPRTTDQGQRAKLAD